MKPKLLIALLATLAFAPPSHALGIVDTAKATFVEGKGTGEAWLAWTQFKKGDKKALGQIQALAAQGNDTARNYVGYILDNGDGAKQDSQTAATYFRAASAKSPLAAYNLGLLYFKGRGVPKNESTAIPLFQQAAKGNIPQAMIRLLIYHLKRGDNQEAWRWAEMAAERGNKIGVYFMGRMLMDGTGPRQDYREAFKWLSQAAELYSPDAAKLLAQLYGQGLGTGQNEMMSASWGMIAAGMSNGGIGQTVNLMASLSDDNRRKAQSFATNWLGTHRKPPSVEYEKTLAEPTNRFGQ